MNKEQILKKHGLTESEFYKLYPTEASYRAAMGGEYNFPNSEFIFKDGGMPCYECGGPHMQNGGIDPLNSTINQLRDRFNILDKVLYGNEEKYIKQVAGSKHQARQEADAIQQLLTDYYYKKVPQTSSGYFDSEGYNEMLNLEKKARLPLKQPGGTLTPKQAAAANEVLLRNNHYIIRGQNDPKAQSAYLAQLDSLYNNSNYDIASKVDSLNKVYPTVPGGMFEDTPWSKVMSEGERAKKYNQDLIYKTQNISGRGIDWMKQNEPQELEKFENKPNPYFNTKKQMGGIMTPELQGTYPSFNYGGSDPSIPTLNQFKNFMKEGGTKDPDMTQDEKHNQIKNQFLSYIQSNVDNHLMEEMHGQMFQTGGTNFWQNYLYGFRPQNTFSNNYFPTNYNYELRNRDFSKLHDLSDQSKLDNLKVNYGPLARLFGKAGRHAFGPKSLEFTFDTPSKKPSGLNLNPFTGSGLPEENIHVIRDPNRENNLGPKINTTGNSSWPNWGSQGNFGYPTPQSAGLTRAQGGLDWRPQSQPIPTPESAGITEKPFYTTTMQGDITAPVTPATPDMLQQNSFKVNRRIPGEEAMAWTLAGVEGVTGFLNQGQAYNQQLKDRRYFTGDYLNSLNPGEDRGKYNQKGEFDPGNMGITRGFNNNMRQGGIAGPTFWDASQQHWPMTMEKYSAPNVEVNSTIKEVPRNQANLEAEGGETVIVNHKGVPAQFKIEGKRHTNGGVPLNVPENSFIFSDTKKMKINDKAVLAQFGMTGGSYTPADIAKKYDLNKYHKILANPDSSKMQKDTAEMMIANYNIKLAKLALAQESKKGFPQGIPQIAMPYIESMQIQPDQFLNTQAQPEQPAGDMAKWGGLYQGGGIPGFSGSLNKASKFAADPETKDAFASYYKALQSNNPVLMEQTAQALEEYDVPFSLGIFPWTKQDKLQDLAGILREKATKQKSVKEIEADYAKKAEDAYNATSYKYSKAAPGSLEALQLHGELQKLASLHPLYNKGISGSLMHESYPHLYTKGEKEYITKQTPINNLQTIVKAEKEKVPTTTYPVVNTSTFMPAVPAATVAPTVQDTVIKKADLKAGKLSAAQIKDLMARRDAGKLNVRYEEDGGQYEYQWGGGYLPKAQDGNDPLAEALNDVVGKKKPIVNRVTLPSNQQGKVKFPYSMEEAYGPRGAKHLGEYQRAYGLPAISETATKDQIKSAVSELQKLAVERNPELVADYMSQRNPKPNNKLIGILNQKGYGDRTKKIATNEDLKKALSEGKITSDELRDAYKDDQWWFRALATNKKRLPRAEYEAQMKKPGAVKQGDKLFFNDPDQPWLYTEYEPYDPETKSGDQTQAGPIVKGPGIQYAPQADYAPWWLQDVIGTAHAAGNLARVKKYAPWQATPEYQLPDPTFYDPTRELAANAEMANIGTQGLSTFTNPQAFAAGFSQIQGQGAKNAADIMGRYNQLNVGVANDFEMKRKEIANNAAAQRAGLATGLADKYTIMNQQFDNSKGIRRDQLVDKYINAITNKQYTANLNDLTDQYKIDPSSGGRIRWTHGRPLSPENQTSHWDEVVGAVKTLMEKGMTKEDAVKLVSEHYGKGKGDAGNSMYSDAAMRGYRG